MKSLLRFCARLVLAVFLILVSSAAGIYLAVQGEPGAGSSLIKLIRSDIPQLGNVTQNLVTSVITPVPEPPPTISALADQANMTTIGRNIFFAAQPHLDNHGALSEDCQVSNFTQGTELGCFAPPDHIYLLTLNAPELKGEMVVTAAHEMLHAVYDNASPSEQAHINAMVEAAAANIKDPALNAMLAQYKITEPGQRDNELHSILGTEYANLPTDLKNYYKQYFTNRSAVVALSNQFKQIFSNLEDQMGNLLAQVNSDQAQMQQDQHYLNILTYNQMVPDFNNKVDTYNQLVKRYQLLTVELQGY